MFLPWATPLFVIQPVGDCWKDIYVEPLRKSLAYSKMSLFVRIDNKTMFYSNNFVRNQENTVFMGCFRLSADRIPPKIFVSVVSEPRSKKVSNF